MDEKEWPSGNRNCYKKCEELKVVQGFNKPSRLTELRNDYLEHDNTKGIDGDQSLKKYDLGRISHNFFGLCLEGNLCKTSLEAILAMEFRSLSFCDG